MPIFVGMLVLCVGMFPNAASAASSSSKAKPEATFGIQPSGPHNPTSTGYIDLNATPGGEITDYVAVTNYSMQPLTLTLHATDAENTKNGQFALEGPTAKSDAFAPWIAFPEADLTLNLAARSQRIVPFRLEVPKNASPGDHAGGILATLSSLAENSSGEKITLLQSVGTRIFVRVSGPLRPKLSVGHLHVKYKGTFNPAKDGKVELSYTVTNTGNLGLGGRQTVWVTGLFGGKTYVKKMPEIQLLLPGSSVQESVSVPGVYPEFFETAHVSISPLVLPGSVEPSSGPFLGTLTFLAIPWALLIGVVLVLLVLAFLAWRWWRKRHPRATSSTDFPGDSPATPDEPAGAESAAEIGDQAGSPATDGPASVEVTSAAGAINSIEGDS